MVCVSLVPESIPASRHALDDRAYRRCPHSADKAGGRNAALAQREIVRQHFDLRPDHLVELGAAYAAAHGQHAVLHQEQRDLVAGSAQLQSQLARARCARRLEWIARLDQQITRHRRLLQSQPSTDVSGVGPYQRHVYTRLLLVSSDSVTAPRTGCAAVGGSETPNMIRSQSWFWFGTLTVPTYT